MESVNYIRTNIISLYLVIFFDLLVCLRRVKLPCTPNTFMQDLIHVV